MSSQLDFQQILQAIFDESTGRISTATAIDAKKFRIVDKSTHINTTDAVVLTENQNRQYLLIQNASNKRIWINFDSTATPGFPSVLLPARSTLIYDSNNLYIGSLNAISESEDTPLIIKEG